MVVEAAGADVLFHLGDIGVGQRVQRWKAREKRGRDLIDALIRTLRGKPHGNHQLIVLFVLQRAQRVRIGFLQRGENAADAFGSFHDAASFFVFSTV